MRILTGGIDDEDRLVTRPDHYRLKCTRATFTQGKGAMKIYFLLRGIERSIEQPNNTSIPKDRPFRWMIMN